LNSSIDGKGKIPGGKQMVNNDPMSVIPAPPIPEGLDWMNTGGKALTLKELRGKLVLLDFWTYG
jgi:hypothetical protein